MKIYTELSVGGGFVQILKKMNSPPPRSMTLFTIVATPLIAHSMPAVVFVRFSAFRHIFFAQKPLRGSWACVPGGT